MKGMDCGMLPKYPKSIKSTKNIWLVFFPLTATPDFEKGLNRPKIKR